MSVAGYDREDRFFLLWGPVRSTKLFFWYSLAFDTVMVHVNLNIAHQKYADAVRFLIVGCSTMAIDFTTYSALLLLTIPIPIAKGCAVMIGTVAAYFLNRSWTFKGTDKNHRQAVWQFCAVYAATLVVNVVVNQLVLVLLNYQPPQSIKITGAFLVSTMVSAALNFLGMKLWVFADYAEGRKQLP